MWSLKRGAARKRVCKYLHSITTRHNDTHPRNRKNTALKPRDGRIVVAVEAPNLVVALVEPRVLEHLATVIDVDGFRGVEHLHGHCWVCAVLDWIF